MKKFAALLLLLAFLPFASAFGDGENLDTGGGAGTPGAALITLTATEAGIQTSSDQSNFWGSGISCLFNQTTQAGDPSFFFTVEGKDSTSGSYYELIHTDAITSANSATSLRAVVYPSVNLGQISTVSTPTSGAVLTVIATAASDMLPYIWRVTANLLALTASSPTPSMTGTIGCSIVR